MYKKKKTGLIGINNNNSINFISCIVKYGYTKIIFRRKRI